MEKQCYVIRRTDDTLSHAQKGQERRDHKYVRREWVGNRWQYWYKDDQGNLTTDKSKAEPQNQQSADRSLNSDQSSSKSKFSQLFDKGKESISNLFSSAVQNINETIDKGKEFITKVGDSIEEAYDTHRWAKDMKNKIDKSPDENKTAGVTSGVSKSLFGETKTAGAMGGGSKSIAPPIPKTGVMGAGKKIFDEANELLKREENKKNSLKNTMGKIKERDKAKEAMGEPTTTGATGVGKTVYDKAVELVDQQQAIRKENKENSLKNTMGKIKERDQAEEEKKQAIARAIVEGKVNKEHVRSASDGRDFKEASTRSVDKNQLSKIHRDDKLQQLIEQWNQQMENQRAQSNSSVIRGTGKADNNPVEAAKELRERRREQQARNQEILDMLKIELGSATGTVNSDFERFLNTQLPMPKKIR